MVTQPKFRSVCPTAENGSFFYSEVILLTSGSCPGHHCMSLSTYTTANHARNFNAHNVQITQPSPMYCISHDSLGSASQT